MELFLFLIFIIVFWGVIPLLINLYFNKVNDVPPVLLYVFTFIGGWISVFFLWMTWVLTKHDDKKWKDKDGNHIF